MPDITPQITLENLTIVSPTIVGQVLAIDASSFDVVVEASTSVVAIEATYEGQRAESQTFTLVGGKRRFTLSLSNLLPSLTEIQVLLTGRNYPDEPTETLFGRTPTLAFNLIYSTVVHNLPIVNAPSGVTIHKGLSTCKIEWATPNIPGFLGVRVQYSTDYTGISLPYRQVGNLIANVDRIEQTPLTISESKAVLEDQTIYTTVETTQRDYFSAFTFTKPMVSGAEEFFVVLSTVVQDPQTNHVTESSFNGPYQCGFVDLRQVTPADFPYLQQKEEIASRLITSMVKDYPDLDLSPRSELRDLHVDPISLELSNQSVREWFGRCAQSVSALSQIDDADGDGFSDEFNSSPYKPQIARAWGLSAQDTQFLIDKQFDILGERVGLRRGEATTAVVMQTFYTYTKPTTRVELTDKMVVGSAGSNEVPSLMYYVRGSAVIDPTSADSIYDPVNGWWAVQLPVECSTAGLIGNVGAGTITKNLGAIPNGWFTINQAPAQFGSDQELNSRYAERIQNRQFVGIDTGRSLGYLETARSTPGVVDANVVPAGGLMMQRDWLFAPHLPGGGKHVSGCVDVYVRGTNYVQQTDYKSFSWQNSSDIYRDYSTYSKLTLLPQSLNSLPALKITSTPAHPIYSIVEIIAIRNGEKIILGSSKARVDNTSLTVYLDPEEVCQKLTGDAVSEAYEPMIIGGVQAKNITVMNYLSTSPGVEFRAMFRLQSPLTHIPQFQPVTSVFGVVGPNTEAVTPRLLRMQDPLLEGFSNRASDTVRVDTSTTAVVTSGTTPYGDSAQFFTEQGIIRIDSNMSVKLDTQGRFFDLNSVRSADMTKLYKLREDYEIVPVGRYHTYGIKRTPNSTIPLEEPLLVAYNKFVLKENCYFVANENLVITDTTPTPLANKGVIHNVWIPESHGHVELANDSQMAEAQIPRLNRYVKVTYDTGSEVIVLREGQDFVFTVDPTTGLAYIAKKTTGRVRQDRAVVSVSYFTHEVFAITTGYPGFVEQVARKIEQNRSAGADVLTKLMMENPVDVIMTVELNSSVTPTIMDGRIRTVIGNVLTNARRRVTQAEIIRQVQALPGVANVVVPLTKFAKSNGAMNIGTVIPSGSMWIPVSEDPVFKGKRLPPNTWITKSQVLPDQTIPSGGEEDAYVGFLYEGEAFRRGMSVEDFMNNPPAPNKGSFYIIGAEDKVDSITPLDSSYSRKILVTLPAYLEHPAYYSYKVTYQIWREGGCKDITLSPTEFLKPGRITIDYM